MGKNAILIAIIIYLLVVVAAVGIGAYQLVVSDLGVFEQLRLLFGCALVGAAGGVLYCLRGVYMNYSVSEQWSDKWIAWYVIRPVVSMICGAVSFLFLKAGLLVLEAQKENDSSNLGFYTLAFIAGMNVDNFISKIEDLADATWGIRKSRTSKNTDSIKEKENQ